MNLKMIFLSILSAILFLFINNSSADDLSGWLFDDGQVAEIHIEISPADLEWIYMEENWESDSLHLSRVHFKNALIDEWIDSVGFRIRGNTSRQAYKKSLKLSFNTFVKGREYYDVDKMNLNGEHNDPSIMRSKIAWDFYQEIGMKASRAAHAAVYINDAYYGLYIIVEHIDNEFLDSRFDDPDGNLWKCLYPADLTYRGNSGADYYPYHDEKRPYELKTNEQLYDYDALARLISILNLTPQEQFEDSLEQVLNVPGLLKYTAMNVLLGSWDDYWSLMNNYYLYHEPAQDLFHIIPYDYDNILSIDWFDVDWSQSDPYDFHKVADGQRPMIERLLLTPRYRNLYTHFLEHYNQHLINLDVWGTRLDSLKEMVTSFAEIDSFRTFDYGYSMDDFHDSFSSSYSNQHVKMGIREFIQSRHESLPGLLNWQEAGPIVYDIDWEPREPGIGDSIYVSASVFANAGLKEVIISYHPNDLAIVVPYPMVFLPLKDNPKVELADRWIGVIPPLGNGGYGRFQISASDIDDRSQSYPRKQFFEVQAPGGIQSDLRINEIMARNSFTISDEAEEYDDWIEIFNAGSSTISIADYYLSDDPTNLRRWRFTSEANHLDPGDFLLVWCDNDLEQSPLHTNFKLDGDGEFIALTAPDGITVIDSLSFGIQKSDTSYARVTDGSGEWDFLKPTPGGSNTGTVIESLPVPQEFSLKLYPNPFNGSVTVEFELLKTGPVEYSIHNITGQKVMSGRVGNTALGRNKMPLDLIGGGLSSGLYIFTLKTPSNILSKKIVVVK